MILAAEITVAVASPLMTVVHLLRSMSCSQHRHIMKPTCEPEPSNMLRLRQNAALQLGVDRTRQRLGRTPASQICQCAFLRQQPACSLVLTLGTIVPSMRQWSAAPPGRASAALRMAARAACRMLILSIVPASTTQLKQGRAGCVTSFCMPLIDGRYRLHRVQGHSCAAELQQ